MSDMRCAIYARYSSDMQRDKSIDDQVRNCRDLAIRQGWKVLESHIYADRAVSGSSLAGRLQLSRLLDVASSKPKPIDYILVDDTSRLSRNQIDQKLMIEEFELLDVYLYFVSQNIDTADDQSNDVLLTVHGMVDSIYVKELAKKTSRGMAGQVLNGFNPGGRVYGYAYQKVLDPSGGLDKKTGLPKTVGTKIEINEAQAEVVRRVYKLFVSGAGYKEIAKLLNADGIEPPGAVRQKNRNPDLVPTWCPTQVRAMLRNPKYRGDWTWNKHRWIKNRKTGKRIYRDRPEDEWVVKILPELRIVAQDAWEVAQSRIKANAKRSSGGKSPGSKYLLTGMLKCGVCGSNMIIVRSSGSSNMFGCTRNWHRGPVACANTHKVRLDELDRAVLDALCDQLSNPAALNGLADRVNSLLAENAKSCKANLKPLIVRRGRLLAEIDNLIEFIAEKGDTSGRIREKLAAKEAEVESVTADIRRAESLTTNRPVRVSPNQVLSRLHSLPKLLLKDIPSARIGLKSIVDHLVMTPEISGEKLMYRVEGKTKPQALLGVTSTPDTLQNSGGALLSQVEETKHYYRAVIPCGA